MRWDKFCEISSAIKKQRSDVANRTLGTIDATENPDDNHQNSLLDLLLLRRGLGASDIRDLVYAHLSLADDYRKDSKHSGSITP
jgi:hypothetical protein